MKGINLSEWAIRHKSLVLYFMLMSVVAGFNAYQRLGRNEDPEFTVKVVVVQTLWPGATEEEMMQQVTDRIEKKLQETPELYYLKSYTTPGKSTIFVHLLQSTPKKDVPEIKYQVRKKVGDMRHTLPEGIVGPSSTTNLATPTGSSTVSRRTTFRTANCAITWSRHVHACFTSKTLPR